MTSDLFSGTLPQQQKPPAVPPLQRPHDELDEVLDTLNLYRVYQFPISKGAAHLLRHLRDCPEVLQKDLNNKEFAQVFQELMRLRCIRFADRSSPIKAVLVPERIFEIEAECEPIAREEA